MSPFEKIGLCALHRLDPERAHELSIRALKAGIVPLPGAPVTSDLLRCELAGLSLPNPIGLAAGYDKNASALGPLMRAGFGFVECGAATPKPQPGNPRPRLFRLSPDKAIINRFGFNNDGAAMIAERLSKRPEGVPVGLNIGANKDSPDRSADFAQVVTIAGPYADFMTVNISSPNTEKLRDLQGAKALAALLEGVMNARNALPRHVPIFVKIAPDLTDTEIRDIAQVAVDARVDAIIATNTTLARDGLTDPQKSQSGGLSGAPLFQRSTQVLATLFAHTAGAVPLIGVGGISTADQIWEKLRAGASAVQLYSAIVYSGFSLVSKLAEDLDQRLRHSKLTLPELIGNSAAR